MKYKIIAKNVLSYFPTVLFYEKYWKHIFHRFIKTLVYQVHRNKRSSSWIHNLIKLLPHDLSIAFFRNINPLVYRLFRIHMYKRAYIRVIVVILNRIHFSVSGHALSEY